MANCSNCDKRQVLCKGLCNACYCKMQRKTEGGKIRMDEYNNSLRGRDSQKRWREKVKLSKPPKPPKPPKENCECGRTSIVKGLCTRCYQKYYARKKHGSKPRSKKLYYEKIFNDVISNIKKGFTIDKSCQLSGTNRGTLYRILTPIQKQELILSKKIGVQYDEDEF